MPLTVNKIDSLIGISKSQPKAELNNYFNTTRITSIHVPDGIDCRLASLRTNSCFSYNLAVLPSVNAKLLCELLSYHKYDNFG